MESGTYWKKISIASTALIKQTHAIRKAIENLKALLLDGDLRTCMVSGIQKGKAEQIIDGIRSLYTVGR